MRVPTIRGKAENAEDLPIPTPDVQPKQSLLVRSNILHEPLKLLVVANEAGRGPEQTPNLLIGKRQRGRNFHQRHSLLWIGNRCEAGINEIDVGLVTAIGRVIEVNDGIGNIYLGGAFTRLSKCIVPCR